MTVLVHVLLVLFLSLSLSTAQAEEPRVLMWKDLVPPAPADNPFAKLNKEQLRILTDVAETRDRKLRGEKLNDIELEDERAAARKLKDAGVDVDALLIKRKEMMDQRRVASQTVVADLDGKTVRIPGYLLPLDFSGKEITEFLLVPWVGACVHTPPPPPNQIVHVKPDKPYANVSLFAPVWVTGQISTKSAKKSLYLVDGTSDVDIGYSLKATLVEPYKQ